MVTHTCLVLGLNAPRWPATAFQATLLFLPFSFPFPFQPSFQGSFQCYFQESRNEKGPVAPFQGYQSMKDDAMWSRRFQQKFAAPLQRNTMPRMDSTTLKNLVEFS